MKQFLHAGEKIKHLRISMALKQDDITNEQVSKSLISMIEKNKRNLTWQTAHIIADSLNKYYKNIGKEITAEYLMESEIEQAQKIVKEDIEKLKKAIKSGNVDEILINNTFEKTIEMITEWNLEEEMMELKILRANFHFHSHRYKEALKNYIDVFDYYMMKQNYNEVASMYITLGTIYRVQMMYDVAIIHFEKGYDIAKTKKTTNEMEIKIHAILNKIICYRKIKQYNIAFSYINILKSVDWNDPTIEGYYTNFLLLEANTFRDVGNYLVAGKHYDRILYDKEKLDKETLFLLYANYADLFQQQGKFKRALVYINKAVDMKGLVDTKHLSTMYLYQAKCYESLEEYDNVLPALENALTLAEWITNPHRVIEAHFALVNAYIKMKDFSKAQQHLEEAKKVISEKDFKDKMNELSSYYIMLYNGLEDREKVAEYARQLQSEVYFEEHLLV